MGAVSMSHNNPDKKYMLKIPVQKRSKETVASIVESCSRLLVQEPYHAITTDKIAEMAGVSIGSLYQFFANKEAIVAAVIDELLQTDLVYIEDQMNKIPQSDMNTKIHALTDIGFNRFHDNRPLRTALQRVQGMLDYWDTRRVFFEQYQKAILKHIPDLPGRDRNMVALFIVSCFNNILHLSLLGPQNVEREEATKKEVYLLISRYLQP
jgi:AcrR family transcriptional regulator